MVFDPDPPSKKANIGDDTWFTPPVIIPLVIAVAIVLRALFVAH